MLERSYEEQMETITFLIKLAIKPNADLQKIRETMLLLAEQVSKKPGARFYQSFQRLDRELEFIESFSDSSSALFHLKNQDGKLAAEWFSMVELNEITVIGPVDEALRAELQSYPMKTKPVYVETISGFPPK